MISLYSEGIFLRHGSEIVSESQAVQEMCMDREKARHETITYGILKSHNTSGDMNRLRLKFDSMTSHDITFVGVIQTARASGMERFPLPYVLTNCHNSLCAVGGTINEDDHLFGLSACKKYGGIFVPPHIAVMHQYMREMMAGCGSMILGSDSHTRYGALGTLGVGEGGGELVKQLLCDTYDIGYPEVIAVYLEGKPQPYVGPQDIALAIIGTVFQNGYVKNKVMEFVGPGVAEMTTDYRNGIDVMTTETTCLTSVWKTDGDTKNYLESHGRGDAYRELKPGAVAYYDGCVRVNLSEIRPMIALPFHPSNVYTIDELNENPYDILRQVEETAARVADGRAEFTLCDKVIDGKIQVQQGIIAGCAGGNYTNVMEAAHALRGRNCGCGDFSLAVYPSSQPVLADLIAKGAVTELIGAGAVIRTAFCGPCFGAGDTPAHNGFSIRHTTRNFPNREGSKPGKGQMAAVALMDARSIAATAANGGALTSAQALDCWGDVPDHEFDRTVYQNRVYFGWGRPDAEEKLVCGPNIKDWPEMSGLTEHILLKVCARIMDPVTTTDELIPSGETSSFRSNPLGLAEFTLSRREPAYVGRAKEVDAFEKARRAGGNPEELAEELSRVFGRIRRLPGFAAVSATETEIGSVIYAVRPGDGSAREQAASCQRVLGGLANICREYATKRYRSNVINWGMLPFQMEEEPEFDTGDYIFVPGIREALAGDLSRIRAYVYRPGRETFDEITLSIAGLTLEERQIIRAGSLINYNRKKH
ncbi:hydratase [Enterocloster asparagiformis]|uniref:hydratase n=1 Tax=Enterocloster asparagiformis TaxID=333367 RepID=UPI002A7EFA25|nr:hydratase [Enterocloster asparagiformis]